MRLKGLALVTLAAGVLAIGCNYTTPVGSPIQMTPAQKDYEAIWQASRSVLHDYYFTLDRQDRRAGIISTLPLVGRQFGEFWRKDAASEAELRENALQTIYRTATVTISELPDRSGAYQVTVQVNVARSDRPEPQISSTSDAMGLFAATGEHSPWMTDFGRGIQPAQQPKLWAASPLEDSVGDGLPYDSSTPKTATSQPTRKGTKRPSTLVSLGRDNLLERKLAQEITAASIHSLGGGARVETVLPTTAPAAPTTSP